MTMWEVLLGHSVVTSYTRWAKSLHAKQSKLIH